MPKETTGLGSSFGPFGRALPDTLSGSGSSGKGATQVDTKTSVSDNVTIELEEIEAREIYKETNVAPFQGGSYLPLCFKRVLK